MLARQESGQGQFFYAFDLDKVVPPDHLERQIDSLRDLSWVHSELASFYSHTGWPSIDPVPMIRMLIIGYVFALRSERRLCAEFSERAESQIWLGADHEQRLFIASRAASDLADLSEPWWSFSTRQLRSA